MELGGKAGGAQAGEGRALKAEPRRGSAFAEAACNPAIIKNQSCTYTTTCDGVISSVGNTSLPAKHAHFSKMSGVTPRVQASWGAADAAALCWGFSLLGSRFGCDQKLWHSSPGRTAAREQPRALHCSHCLFRISISARPGRPMSWRLVEPDCAPPLGPPAAGPRRRPAALRRLRAARWRARRRARPPHARSLKTPSAAVPETAHDLLFSFTKKAKLGGLGGGKRREKKEKKSHPGTVAVTETAHSGARLVERGTKGIGHPEATP